MAKAAELMALPQVQRRDEAITFAPTHVTSVELLLKGERYFPRILEDIAAARDHIHMLFYAIRPGTIADAVVDALDERAQAGLEVKVAVDAIGSGVDSTSRGLYKRMRASGVEVVANDGIAIVRGGRIGNRSIRFHAEDALHFDHRKMMVIDGRVAYVGGTGIEDHFADGRFTDVMCRVTGPIVSQIQLAFLTSWAKDGGPKPPDLVGLFLGILGEAFRRQRLPLCDRQRVFVIDPGEVQRFVRKRHVDRPRASFPQPHPDSQENQDQHDREDGLRHLHQGPSYPTVSRETR